MDSREALIAINLIEHVGPVRARQLLEHFGEAPGILQASKSELLRVRGIGEETAEAIANWEKTVDLAGELKRIQEFGCHVLIQSDADYPESLRQIYDPPLVLYVKGALDRQGQERGGDGRLADDDALRHRGRAQAGVSTGLRRRDRGERRRAGH